ncbi:MAG: glycosyltransferase family 4 protein, partial [Chitinivibrionales bacterium]
MQRPEVVILTDLYWPSPGGMEESIRGVVEALSERFRFSIYTHQKKPYNRSLLHKTVCLGRFKPYRDPAGIEVRPLAPSIFGRVGMLPFLLWYAPLMRRIIPKSLFDALYPFYAAAFAAKITRAIRHADLVHCFSTEHLAILATRICRRYKKPLVQSPYIHFDQWGDTPRLLKAYANASLLVCPTDSSREQLRKLGVTGPARIITNPPLPPRSPEKPRPPVKFIDPPFILFLGRREAHKNLALLANAYKRLPPGTARLVVAGPGEEKALPHTDCIELGLVDEPTKQWLLSRCDIFCVPSTSESFGIVFTEAMSYAKPVVALDVSPVNEIVRSGETGILVRPGDPVALSEALRRLLDNPRERKKMGMAGLRRYEERYEREKIVEKIAEWYQRLICKC